MEAQQTCFLKAS